MPRPIDPRVPPFEELEPEVRALLDRGMDRWSRWSVEPGSLELPELPNKAPLAEAIRRVVQLQNAPELSTQPRDPTHPFAHRAQSVTQLINRAAYLLGRCRLPHSKDSYRARCFHAADMRLGEALDVTVQLEAALTNEIALVRARHPAAGPDAAPIAALQRAQLFLNPVTWCKGAEARRVNYRTTWHDSRATSWSVVGALRATTQNLAAHDRQRVFQAIGFVVGVHSIEQIQRWNDRLACRYEHVARALVDATNRLREGLSWEFEELE